MGWTFTHKDNGISIQAFFEAEFNYTREDGTKGRVIECKAKLDAAYMAFEVTRPGESVVVFGLICLLNRRKEYYNFGYKDMSECMGPNASDCPASVLKRLTPTTNENAIEWRERCYKNIADNSTRKSLKVGDKIKFECEFTFNRYGKTALFEVVNVQKGHYFAYQLGYTVKLTKGNLTNNPWKKI
jgi:hypothetical protein